MAVAVRSFWLGVLCTVLMLTAYVAADGAAFDLSGPKLEIRVDRVGKSLPIARVPNLQPGDRLWIHPLLPQQQGARYLLISCFLRGSTNPPPTEWFRKWETWNKQVREEGVEIIVPQEAQQVLLFLAPETGGDFGSLRSAVRGKPGAFVRASQDLVQASLDRTRLDAYLAAVRKTFDSDPAALHDRSVLLARSLSIKLDASCFEKPVEQQASCITQNTNELVLDDGHSQSMAAALTQGAATDLVGQLSATPIAGAGAYSPYVGAVVDLVRIMGGVRSAEYQYIPALSIARDDELNLKLNNPPSFRKPMSVIVVALPPVEAAQLPPLRPVNPKDVFCAQKPELVLPVEGAPLVFSTEYAHTFKLHLEPKSGEALDLPATPDALRGGFVIASEGLAGKPLTGDLLGKLRGKWGFEDFDGPAFRLQVAHPADWSVTPEQREALVIGRKDVLTLKNDAAACVEAVAVEDGAAKPIKATWKLSKPGELEVQLPLENAKPGKLALKIKQFGLESPDKLELNSYSEAAKLGQFRIHAGDTAGVLQGTRLDEVASLEINGVPFVPADLQRSGQEDVLHLTSKNAGGLSSVHPGDQLLARVALKDGRMLQAQTTVAPPRPKVNLLSKNVQQSESSAIRLANTDDLPQNAKLSFVLQSQQPESFARSEKIQVAIGDNSSPADLSLANGTLTLQDSKTAVATLDPVKSLGSSAFGPVHFRVVDESGGSSDWQDLGNLVRLPHLKEVRCPDTPDKQCTLLGSDLFLIDSLANDAGFLHSVSVPIGFSGNSLSVPRPSGTLLYLKLRDDPGAVNRVALPVLPE